MQWLSIDGSGNLLRLLGLNCRNVWRLCLRILMIGILPNAHPTVSDIPPTAITPTRRSSIDVEQTVPLDPLQNIPAKTLSAKFPPEISISPIRTFSFAIQCAVSESLRARFIRVEFEGEGAAVRFVDVASQVGRVVRSRRRSAARCSSCCRGCQRR